MHNTIQTSRMPSSQNQYIPNRQLQQRLDSEIMTNQLSNKNKLVEQMPQFGSNQHFTGKI